MNTQAMMKLLTGAVLGGYLLLTGCAATTSGNQNGNTNANTDGNVNNNSNTNANTNANANANSNGNANESVAGAALTRFDTTLFTGSGTCATCHSDLSDAGGNDVSIDAFWRSAMMANAATDPFWKASVASEVARHPELREVIEDICAKCHMPMARTQAIADGGSTAMLDAGFLDPGNPLHAAAMDGVSCTVCHQIEPDNLGAPESFSGEYVIDTQTAKPDRVNYGPYDDPDVTVMQSASGYIPVLGEQTGSAPMCATCHTLFTPTVDAAGNIVGEFPEQVPYLEWQHSRFGDGDADDQTCRDCHMPLAEGGAVISKVPGGLPQRDPFYRHVFVGGNVFMLRLLRDNIEALGLSASSEHFDATIQRTEDQLSNDTANLSIVEASRTGNELRIIVRVASLVGHKFPSGFPSRRTWIHLTVADGAGASVFESGAPSADGGIAGNDAATPGGFEPHHQSITSADQVQVYEAIMSDTDGQVTYTLLRAAGYVKDNRLLPEGFDKAQADDDIAVRGAATSDDDFTGGSDRVEYVVNLGAAEGPFTISAELLFQSLAKPFMDDLRQDNEKLINDFAAQFDAADQIPVLVDSTTETVP